MTESNQSHHLKRPHFWNWRHSVILNRDSEAHHLITMPHIPYLLMVLIGAAVPLLIAFADLDSSEGNRYNNLLIAGAFLVNYFVFRVLGSKRFASTITLLIILFSYVQSLFLVQTDLRIFQWFSVYAVVALMLKGVREGLFWILALLIILVLSYGFGNLANAQLGFEADGGDSVQDAVFSTLIITILVVIYERTIQKKIKQLARQRAELQEANARYSALLSGIDDGIVATDREGVVVFANDAMADMLRTEPQALVGQSVHRALQLRDKRGRVIGQADRPYYKVLESGKKLEASERSKEYYLQRQDKTSFPAHISISPMNIEGGTVGAIGVVRDNTNQHNIDEAKDEFVSLASHQLRTPLNSIVWYSDLLLHGRKGKLNQKQTEYAEELNKNSVRMVQLVSDLLDASRLELGKFEIRSEKVNTAELIDEYLDEIKPEITTKKLKISKKFGKQKLTLTRSDTRLFKIVVQNLISNAIKYTPEGGKMAIVLEKVKKGDTMPGSHGGSEATGVLIEVSDTGYGIPKNQQDSVFKKMFRADNVQSVDVEGTGLGLYITRSAIHELGGDVWFESEEGKGTTFWAFFPSDSVRHTT